MNVAGQSKVIGGIWETLRGSLGRMAKPKAEVQNFFPHAWSAISSFFMPLPRSNYDYAGEIGTGLMSRSVMPVIQWIMRVFPEAQLTALQRHGKEWEPEENHPLLKLLQRPNLSYDGGILWMATVYCYCWFGEGYWHILTNGMGQPAELWWMPPWTITPQMAVGGSEFIDHYDYYPVGGKYQRLSTDEVIHFRHGLDPQNPVHGLPPLRSVLREIWADEEASNFVASLLRNSAVTSTLITPDAQAEGFVLGEGAADRIKAYVTERFTGDSRGSPMFIEGPLKVQRLGFAPNELDLSAVRNVTEETVCAALGIRAAVVGFGAGLEQTTVGATMTEEVGMSWTNGVIPMQRNMGTMLGHKLLPLYKTIDDVEVNKDDFKLDWDYSKVKALQEDEKTKGERLNAMLSSGAFRVDEWRTAMGLDSEETDRVYLRNSSMIEVPAGEPMQPPIAVGPRLVPGEEEEEEVVEQRSLKRLHVRSRDGWFIAKADQGAIHRIADRLEPQMRARFLAAVAQTKANIDEDALEAALRIFDADGAMDAIPWEIFAASFGPEATNLLRDAVGQTGAGAARELAAQLSLAYRFDVLNPSAIDWARQHSGRMIKEVTARTAAGIRELVAQSLSGQWTWQQVARQVRDSIGLLERQTSALQKFEARLIEQGVTGERLAARVQRHAEAQLRFRAETIARTEIMTATNMGTQLAWEQAAMQGLMDPKETFKVWIATNDDLLDEHICEPLDGVEVLLHAEFPGGFLQPPAHPRCRCTTGLVFHRPDEQNMPLVAAAAD